MSDLQKLTGTVNASPRPSGEDWAAMVRRTQRAGPHEASEYVYLYFRRVFAPVWVEGASFVVRLPQPRLFWVVRQQNGESRHYCRTLTAAEATALAESTGA